MKNLPFSIKKLDTTVIREVIKNGYEPKREDFINNPELLKYDWFINLAFSFDPRMITLFSEDMLSFSLCEDAINRGFIPTKDDLLNNPILFKYSNMSEVALKNDPRLIIYFDEKIFIKKDVLKYVIDNYHITKEDLYNHPNLCKNQELMTLLGREYELYSAYTSNNRKKEILSKYIYDGRISELEEIPFLNPRFGGEVALPDLMKFINYINIPFNENDTNEQEIYMRLLDKVIDCIVDLNYSKKKNFFKFTNINSLDLFVKESFHNNCEISEISKIIYLYVNGNRNKRDFINYDYILKEITRIHKLYSNDKLTKEDTIDFYNEVLNDFENRYKSEYKRYITSTIKDILKISNKKREAILRGRKIRKVEEFIKYEKFHELGTTKENFILKLQELRNYINSIKDTRKCNIIINDNNFSYFENIILVNGKLDFETVNEKINNKKVSTIIVDKYNQFKMNYISNIKLTDEEEKISILDKEKIEYNYNNYVIGDKKRFCNNLANIILKLDEKTIEKILSNKHIEYNVIGKLLSFANIFEDFDVDNLIYVLTFYDKTNVKITTDSNLISDNSSKPLLNNMSDFIKISKGYALVNEFTNVILGEKVISEIGEEVADDYLQLYLNAYDRFSGSIPRVFGRVNNYTYESGNYRDVDRLCIGFIQDSSCIKLGNLAGENTLKSCILDQNSDVILIKDKNNDLVARMLMFRRGNVVMLAPMVTRTYNKKAILTKDFLDDVANQILNSSKANNDNIDFIFLGGEESKFEGYNEYEIYKDQRFYKKFPHADLQSFAYLVGIGNNISKEEINNYKNIIKSLDYDVPMKHVYMNAREKIKINVDDNTLNRIQALRIKLESDPILKQELTKNFEPFCTKDYKYVISGEDWYIAIKNDGTLQEVLIPTKDERSIIEFNETKAKLIKEYKIK